MQDKRVIFMGTPEFALPIVNCLYESVNLIGIISQPNKEVGRKKIIVDTPTAAFAKEKGIHLMQPIKVREITEEIKELNPDMIVTCAYGQIVPEEILNIPKYGCINVHGSLLPKYSGGAPIQRAIMNGEEKTGITIMYMDKGMDTGDMIKKEEVEIEETDNLETLSNKLSLCGEKLLREVLPTIFAGTNERIKQNDDEATLAPIIKKADELIDFNQTKEEVFNKIRGLSPVPAGYFMMDDKRVKVYESYKKDEQVKEPSIISNIYSDGFAISTTNGEIVITKLQVEGKKPSSGKDYLNGVKKESLLNKRIN